MPLNRSLSVYLDAMRFLAALGVVLSHAKAILPFEPKIIANSGSDCVAVFFVLSGFVIHFVSVEKERNWKQYTSARLARIYPVAILAIIITITIDHIGVFLAADRYERLRHFNSSYSFVDIASYLLFINEVWFSHHVIGSDEPYWSLGFEVAYYIAFAIAVYKNGWGRYGLLLLWALLFGPKVVLYGVLWMLGVLLFKVCLLIERLPSEYTVLGALLFVSGPLIYGLDRFALHLGFHRMYLPTSYQDLLLGFAYYLLVGIAVFLNLIGFALLAKYRDIWPPEVSLAIRWAAGGSFSMYLTHLPILTFIAAVWPMVTTNKGLGILTVITTIALTYLVAELGERRKHLARRFTDHLLSVSRA